MNFFSILLGLISSQQPIFSFLSIGDWGGYSLGNYQKTNILNTAEQLNSDSLTNNYNGILNLGDNFYYCGLQHENDTKIHTDYIDIFGKNTLIWYNTLGNHDYGYNVDAQLSISKKYKQWFLPNRYYVTEFISRTNTKLYLFALDSTPCINDYIENDEYKWDPCGTKYPLCTPYKNITPCQFHQNVINTGCKKQFEWFKETIEHIKQEKSIVSYGIKVIVISHHPIYQINNQDFINIVQDSIVDLYINGHSHIMSTYTIDGISKYITNGAASMVSPDSQINIEHFDWYSKTTGYMRHYIYENYILNQFVDINGKVIHSYPISNSLLAQPAISCSSSGSIANNVKVTLTPENPTIGSKYELTTSYVLTKDITGGTSIYTVSISGFNVLNKKDDLCKDLSTGNTPCPLKAGKISSTINGVIPTNIPHGKYDSKIVWNDLNGEEILCLDFTFTL